MAVLQKKAHEIIRRERKECAVAEQLKGTIDRIARAHPEAFSGDSPITTAEQVMANGYRQGEVVVLAAAIESPPQKLDVG